ncbi:unnamed protein product [Dibothriocephalus latus]|uniref:CRAL-TRIO domain-containing protein n=1 Tax=Dibothriocephalus latus TaxID=60516 RepID=A0A3P7NJD9_DIBLA|nr:unnamed protein product [Dibothriocephalus latus]
MKAARVNVLLFLTEYFFLHKGILTDVGQCFMMMSTYDKSAYLLVGVIGLGTPCRDAGHRYIIKTLEQYVSGDYCLVYFHWGLTSRNKPSFSWMIKAYDEKVSMRGLAASNIPDDASVMFEPETDEEDRLPQQQFGVSLQYIKENNGGRPIPIVVEDTLTYLRDYGNVVVVVLRAPLSLIPSDLQFSDSYKDSLPFPFLL